MIMSMFMTRRIFGKWYPNDALEIVLLWKLIDKYKKDYYERPHIERLTNSRGVNRREAIFMETQNLHTGSFSSPSFSPRQHSQISPAVDFPPTRKTDTWGSQFFWCKHLVKSQKQECLAEKKVRGIVHQFIFLSLWSHILDSNSWFWSKGSKSAPNSKTLVQNFAAPRGVSTSSTTDKAPQ